MKSFFDPKGVFATRNLVVMALMVAFSAVLNNFSVFLTPTQKILSFAYLPQAVAAMLYGPLAGLAVGFVADFVNYIVKPVGAYFPGYAISAMVSNLIYAALLYRKPVALWRVALARALVIAVVTFGLNGVWSILFMGRAAGSFYTGVRVLSNALQYPLDVFLLVTIGRLSRRGRERLRDT